MDNFKKCSKCGQVKLLECFSRDKTRKDGYSVECKKCDTEYGAKYRAKNREKINAKSAEYRAKNPEKRKSATDKYHKKLPDSYIKSQIKAKTGVPYEHITQDLIETKRLHILIQRKLKDLTK